MWVSTTLLTSSIPLEHTLYTIAAATTSRCIDKPGRRVGVRTEPFKL